MPKGLEHVFDELGHHRSIMNWAVLGLYFWVAIYAVKHYPDAVTTVVTVTGGLATAVFTNYVWSRRLDKNAPPIDSTTNVVPSDIRGIAEHLVEKI